MNVDPLIFRINPWADIESLPAAERRFLKWFDRTVLLFLGSACNLECVYCFKMTQAPPLQPLDVLGEQVRRTAAHGFRRVILTGGEPTLHPGLDRLLAMLSESGFVEFGIQSNGLKLADPAFVERLVRGGMRFCHISFDSPDPKTQNELARNGKAFDSIQAALRNLARHPDVTLHIKAVITSVNQDQAGALVEMLAQLKAEIGLSPAVTITPMVPPDEHYSELLVRYRNIAPVVLDAIDAGRRAGLATFYHHVPYCVMDGRTRESIDYFTCDSGFRQDGSLDGETMYLKGPRCTTCALNGVCQGYPGQYAALFGDEAFQPIGGAAVGDRPIPAIAPVSDGGDEVSLRLLIGTVRDGAPEYWSYLSIERRLDQFRDVAAQRVVITGPEPLRHPALPQIVSLLAERGLPVWIETLGLALSRLTTVEALVGRGLRGVRWLHLPATAQPYRSQLGKPLPAEVVSRVGLVLAKAGVEVEHLFLVDDEPADSIRARVESVRRQPFERIRPSHFRLSVVPFSEKWGGSLGLVGLSEPQAAAVAHELSRLAAFESARVFRTIRPLPE
ncbi:radical SAM protein [Candidatus Binatia bacterium]|nr:radical SAM protein [Candidatus Binatia bacterium]